MIKAVIFDFDGTIIDTETAWYDVYRELLKENYAYDLALEDFVKVVGTSNSSLYDKIDSDLGSPLDRTLFRQHALERYEKLKKQLPLRDGFEDVLKELRKQQIPLAIASSSHRDWVVGFLELHGLTEYFPIVSTGDQVKKIKPDPELYTKTVAELGVNPDEVLAVEDSVNGSIAAIRAGIHCLIIPNEITKSSIFDKKAKVIESYEQFDLVQYLKKDHWVTIQS